MNNSSEMDILEDDPRKYFSEEEWQNISDYEKVRIRNTYEIYVDMVKSGFYMNKPEFMTRKSDVNKVDENLNNSSANNNQIQKKDLESPEKRSKRRVSARRNNEQKSRYPKRNQPPKNYVEDDIIPDDHYYYCEVCLNEWVGECALHCPIYLPDTPVPLSPDNPDRARQTVPNGWLRISSSKIRDGGEGVWALKKISKGIRFGPYEGLYAEDTANGEYSWQIKRDGKVLCYIDGQDTSKANWMRYVNCARYKAEQNLAAYQFHGKIYYRVLEDISPGTELLVFYGPDFARELGIDTKNYGSPPQTPPKDNIFECQNCQLAFSSPVYLEQHSVRCRNKKVIEIKGRRRNNETISDNQNNNSKSYKCHLCESIYRIRTLYRYHLLVKHCIYNDSSSSSDKNNKENSNSENSDVNITASQKSIIEELKTECKERKFKCDKCCKAFTKRHNLEIHNRIHTGERPYKCDICKKTFTQQINLNNHQLIHSGARPYECDVCHKSFNQRGHLINHNRIHNNIRPYECTKCHKAFTKNSDLIKHTRIHSGERPYKCKQCPYQATESSHLTRHMRTHTGEKPYTCKHCQKPFTWSSQLKNHVKRFHTDEHSIS